ncbi:DUF6915 family protein [Lutimaribacter degradans]|uniref:DUF6915 family protein n=1 Tax=Lutimaribacter degradans TaxID=2945989 RepID=UPI003DA6A8E2
MLSKERHQTATGSDQARCRLRENRFCARYRFANSSWKHIITRRRNRSRRGSEFHNPRQSLNRCIELAVGSNARGRGRRVTDRDIHAQGGAPSHERTFEAEPVPGLTLTNRAGRDIPTRWISWQNVREYCQGRIPRMDDWLRWMQPEAWMPIIISPHKRPHFDDASLCKGPDLGSFRKKPRQLMSISAPCRVWG